jgi:hypothetical protein
MRKVLAILALFVPCLVWAVVPDPCLYYTFSRTITIDHTKVSAANQTNFVMAISGTYSYLAVTGSGGNIQNTANNSIGISGPADLQFCSSTQPNQPLAYEVSRYVSTTGEIIVWVRVPVVSSSVDTVIYVAYGNSHITTSQQNLQDTWVPAGYVYVQHYEGASTDSSTNGFTGSDTAISYSTGNGKLGQGAGVNGSTSSISIAASTLNDPTPITFEAWANAASFPNSYNSVEGTESGANGHTLLVKSTGKLAIYLSPGPNYDGSGSNTLSTGTWYHLAFSYSAANKLIGYVNGSQDGTSASAWTGSAASIATLIANSISASRHWNGKIDEVRLSGIERSAGWLLTEVNNQNSPSTFYTVGSAVGGSTCPVGYNAQAVTIDHTKVLNTDRTNYKFVLAGTYGCLASTANGGSVQSSSGYDIGLFSDVTCSTRIASEMPMWNPLSGQIALWGLLSSVSHTVDKTIYLCYGSTSITTDQSNKTAIWGANGYVGVYHWGSPTVVVTTDSGSANLDVGTGVSGTPTAAAGPFGGAAHFDGVSASYGWAATGTDTIGAHGYPIGSAVFYLSMWSRKPLPVVCNDCIFGGYGKANVGAASQMGMEQRTCVLAGWTVGDWATAAVSISTTDNASCGGSASTPSYTNDPGWHKWELVYSSAGAAASTMLLYKDGTLVANPFFFSSGTVPNTNNNDGNSGAPAEVRMGRSAGHGSNFFTGDVGEFEVSTSVPDADTIATRYNNESSPYTFYTLGSLTPVVTSSKRRMSQVY